MPLNSTQAPYAIRASSIQVPVTGGTVAIPPGYGTQNIVVSPAGSLANLSVILPASGLDGAEINLIFTQAVTNLTWSGATTLGSVPATVAANTQIVLLWNATSSSWYSEYGNSIGADGIYVGVSPPVDTSALWLDTSDQSGVGVHGIPVGGTANQVLLKSSNADYDVEWATQSGGSLKSIVTLTSNSALGSTESTDYYYFVNSALSTTQTLPTAVGNTNTYVIKNLSTTGIVTINTTSSQTIDGSASYIISNQNHSITLISDGANWRII